MTENGKFLLEMRGICKSFPGVKALDNVSLFVRGGTVHALMGENGAGKSTLMKCLFGVYEKDAGEIYLDGEKCEFKNSKEALDRGVAMVHQELNQALSLSVTENVWLGRFPRYGVFPVINEKEMLRKTEEIFREFGISENPRTKMSSLSVSRRQMIEIAKAVSYGARVMVFDEPTSSLSDKEAERLFEIIEKLKERGVAIIYISHKMEEILKISDEVTVMRDGKLIATKPKDELTTDLIIKLMVGRELAGRFPEKKHKLGDVLLSVEGLTGDGGKPRDASFVLHRGEILGVSGLEGSGRTELLESLFGIFGKRGVIKKDGTVIENKSPREAIKNGFALITEERRRTGIFGILSVLENASITSIKKYKKGPLISSKKEREAAEWCIDAMRVKTPSYKTKIENLSGGNQQKIILGRWLLTSPEILLLDEPTRGIDVGAKYEIYKLITKLAEEGRAVIIVSSEMPELIGLADRILVMSGGRVAGEVSAKEATQEKIMAYAAKYV